MVISILCGAKRQDSFNRKLALWVKKHLSSHAHHVHYYDPADHDLILYDGIADKENPQPLADKMRASLIASESIIFITPEYNSMPSPILFNQISWCSRNRGAPDLTAFAGKRALILTCSPGHLGGMRAAGNLRNMLSSIGMWVAPQALAISKAHEVFSADQDLDENTIAKIEKHISQLF